MRTARRPSALMLGGAAIFLASALLACQAGGPPTSPPARPTPSPTSASDSSAASVAGIVVDSSGIPLSAATVRVQTTTNQTLSDAQGRFDLTGLKPSTPVTISAWKDAYYCDKVEMVTPPAGDVKLVLRHVQTNDNPNYEWIPPTGPNS
jgi:hypothetical protein